MVHLISRILLTLAIVLLTANASKAERIEATYNFVWNGFVVFTTVATVEHNATDYQIDMNVRTRGVMRLFSRGEGDLSAKGVIDNRGRILAQHFISQGRWDGDDYRKEIFFDNEGNFLRWQRDWPEDWLEGYQREAVPAELRRGPDGLSVVMALMKPTLPESLRVFDGDQVLEINLICDDSSDELKKSRHSPVYGLARKCQFGAETVAGHIIETEELRQKRLKEAEKARKRAERYARRYNKRSDDDDQGEEPDDGFPVWLKNIEGLDYALPVRASFKSDWGTVRMYLKELKTSAGLHVVS